VALVFSFIDFKMLTSAATKFIGLEQYAEFSRIRRLVRVYLVRLGIFL